jgi:hypothetical protein
MPKYINATETNTIAQFYVVNSLFLVVEVVPLVLDANTIVWSFLIPLVKLPEGNGVATTIAIKQTRTNRNFI